MNSNEKEKYIFDSLDRYLATRKNLISNANFFSKQLVPQKKFGYDRDEIYNKINLVKNALISFNAVIEENSNKYPENKIFYEKHRQHVLDMLIRTDEDYLANRFDISTIKHKKIDNNYTKTTADYWTVILQCILTGGRIGGCILGIVGAFIGFCFGIITIIKTVAPFHMEPESMIGCLMIGVVISGFILGIVGAIIGGLIGLIIAPLYYAYSPLPVGSVGEKTQNDGLFDYLLVKDLYLTLKAKNIKPLTVDSIQQVPSDTSSASNESLYETTSDSTINTFKH